MSVVDVKRHHVKERVSRSRKPVHAMPEAESPRVKHAQEHQRRKEMRLRRGTPVGAEAIMAWQALERESGLACRHRPSRGRIGDDFAPHPCLEKLRSPPVPQEQINTVLLCLPLAPHS